MKSCSMSRYGRTDGKWSSNVNRLIGFVIINKCNKDHKWHFANSFIGNALFICEKYHILGVDINDQSKKKENIERGKVCFQLFAV